MDYYSPVKGIPHIGVNSSFLREDLHLDYYFLGHYIPEWCDQLKIEHFVKFIERNEWSLLNDKFPEYVIEAMNARRYIAAEPNREIYANIEYYPLMGYYSIIFRALHFAIYTRPKQILLVGCDCSLTGHYRKHNVPMGPDVDRWLPVWINGHKQIKHFLEIYYPDIEVISINPVGLKGLYRDMYTASYLDAHPEERGTDCQIFDPLEFEP